VLRIRLFLFLCSKIYVGLLCLCVCVCLFHCYFEMFACCCFENKNFGVLSRTYHKCYFRKINTPNIVLTREFIGMEILTSNSHQGEELYDMVPNGLVVDFDLFQTQLSLVPSASVQSLKMNVGN